MPIRKSEDAEQAEGDPCKSHGLSHKDHPIWPVLRVLLLVVALGICLWANYDSFDPVKDPRAMLIMAILAGGFEYGKRSFTKHSK